jgi:hypothetical protein
VLHRYFIALHGSSILMHGSVVWLHGCATALRENATLLHGHTMLPHDNSWELRGNTMVLHGYFLVLYRNFLVLQGHPAVLHGNSIMLHGNHQGPCCSPKGLQCRKSVLRQGTAGTDCGVSPSLASHPRPSANPCGPFVPAGRIRICTDGPYPYAARGRGNPESYCSA